jgi:hypothetical protein
MFCPAAALQSIAKLNVNGPANNIWGDLDKSSILTNLFSASIKQRLKCWYVMIKPENVVDRAKGKDRSLW